MTDPRVKSAAARRKRIAALRAKGRTFQQIGDQLGISRQRVHQLAQEETK
jgi:DNA-directed RNA polymerase sigma subunit (sigma70/sigma32)